MNPFLIQCCFEHSTLAAEISLENLTDIGWGGGEGNTVCSRRFALERVVTGCGVSPVIL